MDRRIDENVEQNLLYTFVGVGAVFENFTPIYGEMLTKRKS